MMSYLTSLRIGLRCLTLLMLLLTLVSLECGGCYEYPLFSLVHGGASVYLVVTT